MSTSLAPEQQKNPWQIIKQATGPSLVRRLVLTQVVLTSVIWLCSLVWVNSVISDEQAQEGLVTAQKGAAVIFELVQKNRLTDQELVAVFKRFDIFQQPHLGPGDTNHDGNTEFAAKFFVKLAGRDIYVSDGAPPEPKFNQQSTIIPITLGQKKWHYYQEFDEKNRTQFSVLIPAPSNFSFTPWSRSVLAAPVLLILPIVFFPALLSIWWSLRPWRQFAKELLIKGPKDLSPLQFTPRQQELKPLVVAINQLLKRLQQSSERERHFVADAAHELRTPLAAIHIHLQTLKARSKESNDTVLFETLIRSSERASRLVVQLLALMRSDIAHNAIALVNVDLVFFAQDRLAEFAPQALAKSIDLELVVEPSCADGVFIAADVEGLTSLVDNLVENAIKYSPIRSNVLMTLSSRSSDKVQLIIDDSGDGITVADRDRVFDRFYRVVGQSQPGSGLGLAIVKSVVDRLRATINFSDSVKGGLKVTIEFARAPASTFSKKSV